MNIKNSIEIIERAEKAGVSLIVDINQWDRPMSEWPLDMNVSRFSRCDVVAEARHIATRLERPATPPEGSVYRHSKDVLEAALKRAADYISKCMKENGNVQRSKSVADAGEQPARQGKSGPSRDLRDDGGMGSADGASAGGPEGKKGAGK